jgi:hypothetical protein
MLITCHPHEIRWQRRLLQPSLREQTFLYSQRLIERVDSLPQVQLIQSITVDWLMMP